MIHHVWELTDRENHVHTPRHLTMPSLLLLWTCTHFHLFHKLKHLLWWQASHSSANGLWCLLSWAAVSIWWLNDWSSSPQTSGNKQTEFYTHIRPLWNTQYSSKHTHSWALLCFSHWQHCPHEELDHWTLGHWGCAWHWVLSPGPGTHRSHNLSVFLFLCRIPTYNGSLISPVNTSHKYINHAVSRLMVIPETDDKTNFWEDVLQLLFCCFIGDIPHYDKTRWTMFVVKHMALYSLLYAYQKWPGVRLESLNFFNKRLSPILANG